MFSLLEAKYRSNGNFGLGTKYSSEAVGTTTGRSLRVNKDRQPFRLHPKSKVLCHEELDSTANADEKVGRLSIRSIGHNGRPYTTHNERSGPWRPMSQTVLLTEVTMKLIQGQPGSEGSNACILDLGIRILSGPPELSDVVFADS